MKYHKYSTCVFFTLLPITNVCLVDASKLMHKFGLNVTSYPLSHNWLMLSNLCLSPSSSKTSLIIIESLFPTSPLPRILPFLLSPYVTKSSCFIFKFINFGASPNICFEKLLSKYHSCFSTVQSSCKLV